MVHTDRSRIVFHGAMVLLVGLLCGLPTVVEGETERLWHTAHETLVMIGIMLLAVSSVLPSLVLPRREAGALVWSSLATGYGLMVGLVLQGVTGSHAFSPTTSPVLMTAFMGNITGMLGSVVTVVLIMRGARAAHRARGATGGAGATGNA